MLKQLCRGTPPGFAPTALLVLALWPTPATAQTGWDTGAFVGLLAAHSPVPENQSTYEDWLHTAQYGVSVGRHLTRHLKVEFEAAGSGTGRQSVFRLVEVPGLPGRHPLSAEAETSVRSLTALATWQFFDNEWVHPFVTAGVNANVQRRTVHQWAQPSYPGDPRVPGNQVLFIPEQREGPETAVTWRPAIGGGVKLYVTPRAFVRADARTTLGTAPQTVAFRGGVGFDF